MCLDYYGHLWTAPHRKERKLIDFTCSFRLRFPGLDRKIISIACGFLHVIFLQEGSVVWGMGNNSKNQLTNVHGDVPQRLNAVMDSPIKDVKCGNYHSLILCDIGSLWGCGSNEQSQILNSGMKIVSEFTRMDTRNVPVDSVSAACNRTVILTSEGELYFRGELCGEKKKTRKFKKITGAACVSNVFCVDGATMWIDEKKDLWGIGDLTSFGGKYTEVAELLQIRTRLLELTRKCGCVVIQEVNSLILWSSHVRNAPLIELTPKGLEFGPRDAWDANVFIQMENSRSLYVRSTFKSIRF